MTPVSWQKIAARNISSKKNFWEEIFLARKLSRQENNAQKYRAEESVSVTEKKIYMMIVYASEHGFIKLWIRGEIKSVTEERTNRCGWN